jgi:hypothetical protein
MTEASFTTDTHDLFKKLIAAAAATTIFAPRVLLHWPRAALHKLRTVLLK